MLIMALTLSLTAQAAPLENPAYTEMLACTASLSAAIEVGPTGERQRSRAALDILVQELDRIDMENQDDPGIRLEAFDEMRRGQIAVDAWQGNVDRCRALAARVAGP